MNLKFTVGSPAAFTLPRALNAPGTRIISGAWGTPSAALPTGLTFDPLSSGVSGTASGPAGVYVINFPWSFSVGVWDYNNGRYFPGSIQTVEGATTVEFDILTVPVVNLVFGQLVNWHSNDGQLVNWMGSVPPGLSVSPVTNNNGVGILSLTGVVGLFSGEFDSTFAMCVVSAPNASDPPVISCAEAAVANGVNTVTIGAGVFGLQFSATNSGAQWSASLPGGLNINSFGLVYGTLSPGSYPVVVQCQNFAWSLNSYTNGPTQTATYILHLMVTPALPIVGVGGSGFGGNYTVGDDLPNSAIFGVQDYAKPVTWSATGLPDGAVINQTSGFVSGKLTTAGTYNVTVSATNSTGTGTFAQVIVVEPNRYLPVVSLAAEQPGATGGQSGYGVPQLSFAVGTPVAVYFDGTYNPTSWAAADLPNGLAIDATTGVVSGLLRAPGSFRFFVTATNSVGASNTLPVTVTATGAAQAFEFVSADPTLTDVQIDVRTGAISSSLPLAFKQLESARLAIVFLDFGTPIVPPVAGSVVLGMRPAGLYDEDFLFAPPACSLVAASEGQPAYLLAEFVVEGDEINARLADAIARENVSSGSSALFTAMAEIAWTQGSIPRISDTFQITFEPAVTGSNN